MIAFIGGGNMAEALLRGLTRRGKRDIIVSEPRAERRQYLERTYGVRTTASNQEAAQEADILVLAVKPQVLPEVLRELAPVVDDTKTVVSIAAGVRLQRLQEALGTRRLVRVMPNAPALVGQGMSVMSLCECFSDEAINRVKDIFMSVGTVLSLPEHHMDAVTALSGSGPAFFALYMEALLEASLELGLPEAEARELLQETLQGTLALLQEGLSPQRIRQMVTSPGGTTEAGLGVLKERGFEETVKEALLAAARRARELSGG
jgi:pyrroline-5-carboxylate reductase